MTSSELEVQLLAARAQLLALRASLPEAVKVARDRIRLLPDQQLFTEEEVATALAARQKPLQCAPSLKDGTLCISAEQASADWIRVLTAMTQTEVLDTAKVGAKALILLKGRDESLALPGPAYLAWRQDYLLPNHCALSGWAPTDAEASAGFTYVWQAGRTEPPIEVYSLSADSSVLCDRCGRRLATAFFRNRSVNPPLNELLCADCIDAEQGRKLVSVLNESAETPPFPEGMTDEELRHFWRRFRLGPSDKPDGALPK